jgi:hypothetical protein
LAANQANLSSEEKQRHEKQLAYIERICSVFEQEQSPATAAPPTQVVELMQEVWGDTFFCFALRAIAPQCPRLIAALMHALLKLQECGQLPTALLKELSPELEFGEDGTPKLPAMADAPCSIM